MKTSIRPRTRITAILGLTLLTSFTLSTVVFAAKGGGKGKPGDGGGEDPPPVGEVPPVVAAPITYEAQFFGLADVAETAVPWAAGTEVDFYFDDINRDGVAVGQAWTGPFPGTGYAIMGTAAGGIRFLDTVFEVALATTDFAGFRIVGAWKINAAGQIACSLADAAELDRWVAVGDLNERTLTRIGGPLVKTSGIYPVSDLNEAGDVITSEIISVTRKRKTTLTGVHRLHLATVDSPLAYAPPVELSQITAITGPTLNTTPLQVAYASADGGHRFDLMTEQDITIPGTNPWRIADDGSVYTFVATATSPDLQGYPARWTELGLQPLAELQTSSPKVAVVDVSEALVSENEAIEVIMARGARDSTWQTDIEIYRAGTGANQLGSRYAVNITHGEVLVWEAASKEIVAVSRPNGSGHGLLCGQVSDGSRVGFILTPVAP